LSISLLTRETNDCEEVATVFSLGAVVLKNAKHYALRLEETMVRLLQQAFVFGLSWTLLAAPSLRQTASPSRSIPTALLLDQDNNGLDLTTPEEGVRFDLDGDGVREEIGWTRSSKDGFLVLDVNKNGTIDNGTEIVGTGFKHPLLAKSMNGLDALFFIQGAVLGPDGQPVIQGRPQLDGDDLVFREFRVWFDGNHNGRSEPDELSTLRAASITEFSPGYRMAPASGNYSPGVIVGSPGANTVKYYGRYSVGIDNLRRTAFEVLLQRK